STPRPTCEYNDPTHSPSVGDSRVTECFNEGFEHAHHRREVLLVMTPACDGSSVDRPRHIVVARRADGVRCRARLIIEHRVVPWQIEFHAEALHLARRI